MRVFVSLLVLAAMTAGCGRQPGLAAAPADGGRARSAVTVTSAFVRLSVKTHHGADALSGLRVSGMCERGPVRLNIGHRSPYARLRDVGIPQIDRTRPPRRYPLRATCRGRRFSIRVPTLAVRDGSGPLLVRGASPATTVRVVAQAIE